MKREGDEVEKLVQLCVLIVGIAKVFHFLRNYVGEKKDNMFKYYIHREGAFEILFLLGSKSSPLFG